MSLAFSYSSAERRSLLAALRKMFIFAATNADRDASLEFISF